jgi:ribose/xylose/arabinose/galactoside ABC-type transport system permease subunit
VGRRDGAAQPLTPMRAAAWQLRSAAAVSRMPVLILCACAVIAFSAAIPGFASSANLAGIMISSLPLLLLATGQTFVLVSGGIDLSTTAIVGLVSVAGGLVMSGDAGLAGGHAAAPVAGLFVMIGTGALAGLVNGACVGVLRMPAFMVTLTLGMFAGGLAVLLVRLAANTETMFNLPRGFVNIGGTPLAAAIVACGAAVFAQGLLGSTRYGRMLQAVGYSPRAARASGVPVARVTAGAYVTGGIFAALAAILLTGSLETASPTLGRPLLLDVIGATVIGGTSLSGGRGHVWGTALGVVFLALLVNALTLLNLSDFVITIVKGLVILMAAIMDRAGGRN